MPQATKVRRRPDPASGSERSGRRLAEEAQQRADRVPDRVGLVWQRFDELRERADWMVSRPDAC